MSGTNELSLDNFGDDDLAALLELAEDEDDSQNITVTATKSETSETFDTTQSATSDTHGNSNDIISGASSIHENSNDVAPTNIANLTRGDATTIANPRGVRYTSEKAFSSKPVARKLPVRTNPKEIENKSQTRVAIKTSSIGMVSTNRDNKSNNKNQLLIASSKRARDTTDMVDDSDYPDDWKRARARAEQRRNVGTKTTPTDRERLSRFIMSSRTISQSDIDLGTTGRRFVSIFQLSRMSVQQAQEVSTSGDWFTIMILAERGDTRLSASGTKFQSWSLTDLTHFITCFVFREAYETYKREVPGQVMLVFKPEIVPAKDTNKGFSLSIADASQVTTLGRSADFAYCKGTRKDGKPCTVAVNGRIQPYCPYHMKTETKKILRGEIIGASSGTIVRPKQPHRYNISEGSYSHSSLQKASQGMFGLPTKAATARAANTKSMTRNPTNKSSIGTTQGIPMSKAKALALQNAGVSLNGMSVAKSGQKSLIGSRGTSTRPTKAAIASAALLASENRRRQNLMNQRSTALRIGSDSKVTRLYATKEEESEKQNEHRRREKTSMKMAQAIAERARQTKSMTEEHTPNTVINSSMLRQNASSSAPISRGATHLAYAHGLNIGKRENLQQFHLESLDVRRRVLSQAQNKEHKNDVLGNALNEAVYGGTMERSQFVRPNDSEVSAMRTETHKLRQTKTTAKSELSGMNPIIKRPADAQHTIKGPTDVQHTCIKSNETVSQSEFALASSDRMNTTRSCRSKIGSSKATLSVPTEQTLPDTATDDIQSDDESLLNALIDAEATYNQKKSTQSPSIPTTMSDPRKSQNFISPIQVNPTRDNETSFYTNSSDTTSATTRSSHTNPTATRSPTNSATTTCSATSIPSSNPKEDSTKMTEIYVPGRMHDRAKARKSSEQQLLQLAKQKHHLQASKVVSKASNRAGAMVGAHDHIPKSSLLEHAAMERAASQKEKFRGKYGDSGVTNGASTLFDTHLASTSSSTSQIVGHTPAVLDAKQRAMRRTLAQRTWQNKQLNNTNPSKTNHCDTDEKQKAIKAALALKSQFAQEAELEAMDTAIERLNKYVAVEESLQKAAEKAGQTILVHVWQCLTCNSGIMRSRPDICYQEEHEVETSQRPLYYWECKQCKQRSTSLSSKTFSSCKKCGNRIWIASSAIKTDMTESHRMRADKLQLSGGPEVKSLRFS